MLLQPGKQLSKSLKQSSFLHTNLNKHNTLFCCPYVAVVFNQHSAMLLDYSRFYLKKSVIPGIKYEFPCAKYILSALTHLSDSLIINNFCTYNARMNSG